MSDVEIMERDLAKNRLHLAGMCCKEAARQLEAGLQDGAVSAAAEAVLQMHQAIADLGWNMTVKLKP